MKTTSGVEVVCERESLKQSAWNPPDKSYVAEGKKEEKSLG